MPRDGKSSKGSELDKKIKVQQEYFKCPSWVGSPKKGVRLEVRKGNEVKDPFKLDKFPYYLIGRHEFLCDFFVQHKTLSRVHCAIVHHRSGSTFIIDLGSAFGTMVNGKKLAEYKPTKLAVGDEIRLGQSTRKYILKE
eukprot:TRINITY_DN48844_c1_g1_i1.p1 TRINITY_DN48844_c1_g1~~TRINITY_DN48844_c1_g1_i1.p1  ORF type:complete len:138 (+),score=6.99 TRINITY_DN48844_c1_g1_i1:82-495(+)